MELPKVNHDKQPRQVSGEIVYLDEMRRVNQVPARYDELADMAIDSLESTAGLFQAHGARPEIMDEYERYDLNEPEIEQIICLADELLKLKQPDSPLTFVDVAVEVSIDEVKQKLANLNAGQLLADIDEQIAIESNGDYYPVLDIRKSNSRLAGVSVRAWGWNDRKVVFTNQEDEAYEYPKHALFYPSNEKSKLRELDVAFIYYTNDTNEYWSEKVAMQASSEGRLSVSSNYIASAYLETGYEGHGGKRLENLSKQDCLDFAEFIAEIVGDQPISVYDKNEATTKLTNN